MSDKPDIEAIRARLAAAVRQGTWTYDSHTGSIREGNRWCPVANWVQAKEDADFIAHAPTDIAALLAEVERLRACCERRLVESARLRVLEHAVRAGGACSENVMSARAAIAAMGAVALPEKATPSMRHAAAIEEQRVVAGEANTERYARLWRAMLAAWREETGR